MVEHPKNTFDIFEGAINFLTDSEMVHELDGILMQLEGYLFEVVIVHFIVDLIILSDDFAGLGGQVFEAYLQLIHAWVGFEVVHGRQEK